MRQYKNRNEDNQRRNHLSQNNNMARQFKRTNIPTMPSPVQREKSVELRKQEEAQFQTSNTLPLYSGGAIKGFSTKELNDAILTTYGELTIPAHSGTSGEAHAIASTIFNRIKMIRGARVKHKGALNELGQAKAEREKALEIHDSITYKSVAAEGVDNVDAVYKSRLAKAKAVYKTATQKLGDAQRAAISAKSALDNVEVGTISSSKIGKRITLSDIVSQNSQYEGTKKGISDHAAFSSFGEGAKDQHRKRFAAAKQAVLYLAKCTNEEASYWSFVGGNLRPNGAKAGETKIGGNYFKNKK